MATPALNEFPDRVRAVAGDESVEFESGGSDTGGVDDSLGVLGLGLLAFAAIAALGAAVTLTILLARWSVGAVRDQPIENALGLTTRRARSRARAPDAPGDSRWCRRGRRVRHARVAVHADRHRTVDRADARPGARRRGARSRVRRDRAARGADRSGRRLADRTPSPLERHAGSAGGSDLTHLGGGRPTPDPPPRRRRLRDGAGPRARDRDCARPAGHRRDGLCDHGDRRRARCRIEPASHAGRFVPLRLGLRHDRGGPRWIELERHCLRPPHQHARGDSGDRGDRRPVLQHGDRSRTCGRGHRHRQDPRDDPADHVPRAGTGETDRGSRSARRRSLRSGDRSEIE